MADIVTEQGLAEKASSFVYRVAPLRQNMRRCFARDENK